MTDQQTRNLTDEQLTIAVPVRRPVGDLLAAAERSPMRPAHVHFKVSATGYESLVTHVFADGDEHLDADPVFGAKTDLIARIERQEPGIAPDGTTRDTPFYTITYHLVLARVAR